MKGKFKAEKKGLTVRVRLEVIYFLRLKLTSSLPHL